MTWQLARQLLRVLVGVVVSQMLHSVCPADQCGLLYYVLEPREDKKVLEELAFFEARSLNDVQATQESQKQFQPLKSHKVMYHYSRFPGH